MTPYEFLCQRGDVFVCGDGTLWVNSNEISAKTARLTRWDPCEDLSEEDNKESAVTLELIGLNKDNSAVICSITNNGSKKLASKDIWVQVKLGDEWYWAYTTSYMRIEGEDNSVYPGESTETSATLYTGPIENKNIVPPGHYRVEYAGTEPSVYLEFDLVEKDGILSAVAAEQGAAA